MGKTLVRRLPIFRKSIKKLPKYIFQSLLLLSVLTSNFVYPVLAIAQEAQVPIDTSEDILEDGISTSIYEDTFIDGVYTVNSVEEKEYVYPENTSVRINFSNITQSGNLVIKKVLLTEDEKVSLNTKDTYAWDITSTMPNGTFTYDLTLPNTAGSKAEVKYTEDGSNYSATGNTLVASNTITVRGLNHFTKFVVVQPLPSGVSNGDVCVIPSVSGMNKCYDTIQGAIDASNNGDTITISKGIYTLTSQLNINKSILIKGVGIGETILSLDSSAGNHPIKVVTNNVTIQNLEIVKTDKINQNIIYVGGDSFTLRNCSIHGQFNIGDSQVSRAMEVTYGIDNLQITGNQIYNLRQPAYINGSISSPTTGVIKNNKIYSTKGWVIDGANMNFTNNKWGDGTLSQTNWKDIAILSSTDSSYYTDILEISKNNNNAIIEDQRTTPRLNTTTYVSKSGSDSNDGSPHAPFLTIARAIQGTIKGGKVLVSEGTYTENILIDKDLTLKGTNKSNTIISGNNTGVVVTVLNSKINITDFTIQRSGLDLASAGLALLNSNGSNIERNNFSQNMYAIFLGGSNNNRIYNNNISNNSYGLVIHNTEDVPGFRVLLNSQNNIVERNTIQNSVKSGIELDEGSHYNTIKNNNILKNGENGIYIWHSDNNNIEENTIARNLSSGIDIQTSVNSTFTKNNISKNKVGVNIENGWINGSFTDSNGHIFNYNNIYDNKTGVIFNKEYSDQNIDFTLNYWGHHTGPYNLNTNPTGMGNSVTEDITVREWLCEKYSTDWISQNGVCRIDTPQTLGWNVSSLTSNPGQNPTTLQCGGVTNDNTPSHVWSSVDKEGIKYQRQAKTPSGGWWTDPKAYTNTNTPFVWFGNAQNGWEGTWNTKVRAWIDTNGNDQIDFNEIVSDWSNECPITYDKTAPNQVSGLNIYKGHNSDQANILGCGGYTNNTKIRIQWEPSTDNDLDYYWFGTKTNSKHKQVDSSKNWYDGNMTPGNNPYAYTVIAVDKAGNESPISNQCTLTLDTTKPSTPTNLRYENLEGETLSCGSYTNKYDIIAKWDTSTDDTGIQYYEYQSYNPTTGWVWGTPKVTNTERKGAFTQGEGTYGFRVRAVDMAGNTSDWTDVSFETSCQITYDKTAPLAPTLISPTNNIVTRGDTLTNTWSEVEGAYKYIYQSYSDSGANNIRWTLETDQTSKTATKVANTIFWWRVKAIDKAGNESPWSTLWKITVDNDAPVVDITSHRDGDLVKGITDLKGSVQDSNLLRYYYRITGPSTNISKTVTTSNQFTDQTFYTWDTTKHQDGEYEIRLEARDKANNKDNNISVKIINIVVDNTKPEVESISNYTLNEGENIPNITGTVTDNHGIEKVCYDVDGYTDCITPTLPTNNWIVDITDIINNELGITTADTSVVDEGDHSIKYYAQDNIGNISEEKEFKITILNNSPVLKVSLNNDNIVLGEQISAEVEFTDDGKDDAPWTYTINYGDGITETGSVTNTGVINTFLHTYTTVNTYNLKIEICESTTPGENTCTNYNQDITVNPILTDNGDVQGVNTTNTPRTYSSNTTYTGGVGGSEDIITEVTSEENIEEVKGVETCDNEKKLFGHIYQDTNGNNMYDEKDKTFKDITVKIYTNTNEYITEIKSNKDGYWETYLCSGDYNIRIEKDTLPNNYETNEDVLSVNISDTATEISANYKIEDNRNFWQKNWIWIVLLSTVVVSVGYIFLNSNKKGRM